MCVRHLENAPDDAQALSLMSRLCMLGGDSAAAIAFASLAARADPGLPQARVALEAALTMRPDPPLARQRLAQALEIEPEIAWYERGYGAPPPFAGIDRARALLEEAVRLDPALAPAHAALANVLSRQNHVLLAVPEYRHAIDIDPQQPQAALALSELLFDLADAPASERYRERALLQQQLYPAGPRSAGASRSVLVLNAPAPWAANTPLEFMIAPERAALHRLYLTGDPLPALPAYDVVFNAIGEAERAHPALERARAFAAAQSRRVINDPARVGRTARPNLASSLRGVFGCTMPDARRVARAEIESAREFPLLVRPVDTHAGRGLERVEDARALRDYLARHPDERFDVTPYVEYRSADGFYRKYRVVLVDGAPYPYHLAISPDWMVHYVKSPTASVAWMRAEEERFLREPQSVFLNWERTFEEIGEALGLDYVGVDCALLESGHVLMFEADTALLVHCREPADSYKQQYVPRIFRAVEALLATP